MNATILAGEHNFSTSMCDHASCELRVGEFVVCGSPPFHLPVVCSTCVAPRLLENSHGAPGGVRGTNGREPSQMFNRGGTSGAGDCGKKGSVAPGIGKTPFEDGVKRSLFYLRGMQPQVAAWWLAGVIYHGADEVVMQDVPLIIVTLCSAYEPLTRNSEPSPSEKVDLVRR